MWRNKDKLFTHPMFETLNHRGAYRCAIVPDLVDTITVLSTVPRFVELMEYCNQVMAMCDSHTTGPARHVPEGDMRRHTVLNSSRQRSYTVVAAEILNMHPST